MNIAETIDAFRRLRAELRGPVGLVATMGALHEGHLSLVRRAREECASVVASVFVNPTQFAANEDLASYPRDLDRDLRLLEAEGVDAVFHPKTGEIYPEGFDTWVTVGRLTDRLEGADRPTHFRGVTTIVAKLLHVVAPDQAYFGRKDAQQALAVRRMIRDLDFDVELVVCPTVREPDGLAMSSRNTYLPPNEREAATVLSRCLRLVEALYADGERDAERLRAAMRETLAAEPLARPSYVSVADLEDLTELETVDRPALVSLAVRIGTTRLLDNVLLPPEYEIR